MSFVKHCDYEDLIEEVLEDYPGFRAEGYSTPEFTLVRILNRCEFVKRIGSGKVRPIDVKSFNRLIGKLRTAGTAVNIAKVADREDAAYIILEFERWVSENEERVVTLTDENGRKFKGGVFIDDLEELEKTEGVEIDHKKEAEIHRDGWGDW